MQQQESSTPPQTNRPPSEFQPVPLTAAELAQVSGAGPNGGWSVCGPNGGWL
jgi:hypothetical protein